MKITYFLLASFVATLACCAVGSQAWAADGGGACVHQAAPKNSVGKRVAVVVGDGAYTNKIPVLPNPANDAETVAKAVGALGFEVFLSLNADSAGLQKCLDEAYAGLANTDVAMFYYSGHGIQIKDENYLVATDAGLNDFKHGFVPVQPIVDALQKQAKATLVLLDACRNNPMTEGGQAGLSVSTGRGLGRVTDGTMASAPANVQARGLMVAYSTSPNAVAQDGTGRLSPFTGAFIKTVGTSGYSIQRVMGDVTKIVGEETDYAQTPWMKSSLSEELKLSGGDTLDEARSLSDNDAARSTALLQKGKKQDAIIEALKGLPANPDEAALKRFPNAYLALYSAVQSHEVSLPLSPVHSTVAVSTQDRAAVFAQTTGVQSGEFQLWSISEQKLVATLPVGKGVFTFLFSPHGKYLAVQSNIGVSVFNGVDGTKLFDVRGRSTYTSMGFSPDETRLLLADEGFMIVDVATGKSSMVAKAGQLDPGERKRRFGRLAQATFGGNDAICFILNVGDGNKGVLGVFDLKDNKTVRLRDTDDSVTVLMCDPAGKYMVRVFAVGSGEQGMEIWDLANDKVTEVKAPIVNILGMDPKGNYVSGLAFDQAAEGLYDLATGKKGYPPTIPEGYSLPGAKVYNASGAFVSQDLTMNPWRDWPDESLFGLALVAKAMAGLTSAQRDTVAHDRINFAVVAGNR